MFSFEFQKFMRHPTVWNYKVTGPYDYLTGFVHSKRNYDVQRFGGILQHEAHTKLHRNSPVLSKVKKYSHTCMTIN
jgi:hypothetical protein